jgi:two-component system response regulator DevR
MSAPITVFLLDDHEIVRRGLADLLRHEDGIGVVGEADRAEGAADAILASRATVALLDCRLPDGSGIDVCRDVKSIRPETSCLLLTAYDDDEAVLAAVLSGANGYLLTEARARYIVDAIRRVAKGESLLDASLTEQALARAIASAAASPFESLTPRESEVLGLLVAGRSNREIGAQLLITEKTVKSYISAVLVKLGLQSNAPATALGDTALAAAIVALPAAVLPAAVLPTAAQ